MRYVYHQRLVLACALLAAMPAMAAGDSPVDARMILWTWIAFALLAIVLYKFAFKPILLALDQREETIRTSLDDAERIRQEIARLEETQERMISDAETKSRELIDEGRQAAKEAARVIEDKAREEAQIMLENAQREIRTATEVARASLRRESADLAVKVAGKLLEENLDDQRNRQLVDRLIAEV